MTGKLENHKRCPVCGGSLEQGEATIPYVLKDNTVIVVKNVPAEICGDCHEPFTEGKVTDQLVAMAQQLKELHSEVSVVTYREYTVV
jgi:YgiT-type zinc finger domain-containing protein